MSSLQYVPILVVSSVIGIFVWGQKQRIERWVDKNWEPIEPVISRRRYIVQLGAIKKIVLLGGTCLTVNRWGWGFCPCLSKFAGFVSLHLL